MSSSIIFGALADDLTGAVELAAMLQAGGARTRLLVGADAVPDRIDNTDAVVVALRTRVAPPAQAVATCDAVAARLLALDARQLFLKYCASFDSLDTGNIGNVAEALRRHGAPAPVLFCPSFPEAGRTVFHGHMFIGMQLLADSPKRHDPLTPMTRSNLVEVLAPQTTLPVGVLPFECVAEGADAIRRHAQAALDGGVPFLIADAILPADLRSLAAASVVWPLMTGGSSVAAYYPPLWRERGWIPAESAGPQPGAGGFAAVLAGSCAERTREQVAHFAQTGPVLSLDPMQPLAESVAQALDWAAARMPQGPVCITTSDDPARVAAAQAAQGAITAGRQAEALLAAVAEGLVRRGVRRLLVAGGETSGAVVEALGIESLQVAPFNQIGVGRCRAERPEPLALCLKSGKLGSVDMFTRVLAEMEFPA
jgi:uncharacterized protein YgbK (DUF1537 family)